MKVLVVFGTRPEAIKLAPVIRELRDRAGAPGQDLAVRVCVTAQHREIRGQVLRLFEIVPDYDLNLEPHGGGSNSDASSRQHPVPPGTDPAQ